MSQRPRRPAAFRLDDRVMTRPAFELAEPSTAAPPAILDIDSAPLPVELPAELPPRRRFRWGLLFWSAAGGLACLAALVAVLDLIDALFSRSAPLGWLGVALSIFAAASLAVVGAREAVGLLRLAKVERLHQRASAVVAADDRTAASVLVRELVTLTRGMPRLARARTNLEAHLGEIIDGADLVRLAERELMTPLDKEARRLVSAAATRVSVVTAVSSRAGVDMLFVFGSAVVLIRRLAFLYGARPGALGLLRLLRHVISHLAITGGLATSDNLIQQLLGHGIAAKLSARLGEGLLNGLLTARLGLAAIDVIRPLPFAALSRPKLGDLMTELVRGVTDNGVPAPDKNAGTADR